MSLKELISGQLGDEILSYLNIYDFSKLSMVCDSFSKAIKAAVLLRTGFSDEEYRMMLDLENGVGELLLFQLCNSPVINFQKKVKSTMGEHDIFLYACYKGFPKAVHCLLFHIRHPSSEALVWACCNNRAKVVEILLEDNRIDASFDRNLPLRIACGEGHLEIVKLLLAEKAVDPKDLNNDALEKALHYKHVDVVEYLVRDGRTECNSNVELVLGIMDDWKK